MASSKVVVYILPNLTLLGGTPKKIIPLLNAGSHDKLIFITSKTSQLPEPFINTDANFVWENGNVLCGISALMQSLKSYDKIIIQTQFTRGIFYGAVMKLLKYSSLALITTVVGPFFPSRGKYFVQMLGFALSERIIVVSDYILNELFKSYPLILKNKVVKIYNGIDFLTRRHSTNYTGGSVRFISVSGLIEWKNILIIIESLKILKSWGVFPDYTIYGDGPQRQMLKQKCDIYGLDNVKFAGYTLESNINYKNAVFLHPSKNEAFGIAVIEAMARGLKIICSSEGGLLELGERPNVTYLSYNDANAWASQIKHCIENPESIRKEGTASKTFAQNKFSSEIFIDQHMSMYKELWKKL